METTKKLNETPLIQEMTADHTYVIVDSQGNVSRMNDVPKKYVTETELSDFIKPYDERITTNETDIENVKTDALDLETYIDTITPKNTASGEIVHTTDALPLPTFGTKSGGNVEQETTKGYNFLPPPNTEKTGTINGLTYTFKIDGSLTLNGTTSASTEIQYAGVNKKLPVGTYILVTKTDKLNNMYFWTADSKVVSFNVYETISITEEHDIKNVIFQIQSGVTFNNETIYPLLTNDKTQTEFEKYTNGASPNPEYPQEIEVLEAYNLFDKNNYILDTWDNNFDAFQVDLKAGTYTLSCNSIMSTIKGSNHIGSSWDSVPFGTSEKLKTFTFTINQDYKGGIVMRLDDGTQINHTNISDYDIRIVDGIENKPYVPYGCVGYKVYSKNMLNNTLIERGKSSRYGDIGSIPNESYNSTIATLGIKNPITIEPNTSYTVTIPKGFRVAIAQLESDLKSLGDTGWLIVDTYTITTKPNAKYVGFNFGKSDSTDFTDDDWNNFINGDLQFELSDKRSTFEPYKEQIVPLDLKGNWVGYLPSIGVRDILYTDKKHIWLEKNVVRTILNGSENWAFQNLPNTTSTVIKMLFDYGNPAYISSHFICNLDGDNKIVFGNEGGNVMFFRISNDVVGITDSDSDIVRVEKIKTWLSNNNVEIQYKAPKPQIIELGELPEPIKTFEGVNNIRLLANLDTEIEVVYVQDVKKYIDSKLAEISAQII